MKKLIILIGCIVVLCFLLFKIFYPIVMRVRGKRFLYKKLFFHNEATRNEVLSKFHEITGRRFTNSQAIDFFMKEKGLQLLSVTPGTPLILKYYLSKSPKAVLTYFEKVRFHETFIMYETDSLLKR